MRAISTFFVLGLLGCVARPVVAPTTPPATITTLADVHNAETAIFRELAAADPRFARRAQLEPTQSDLARAMQASLASEEAGGLLAGAPDPFTRAARGTALKLASQRLADLGSGDAASRNELRALRAVLREEEARFTREATLPGASVRLIHALAAASPPRSSTERDQNDAALTRRLGEIEDSLDSADSLDGDSIEDALDELEPRVSLVYPEATKALTSLRLAAARDLPTPTGARSLPALASSLPAGIKDTWITQRASVRKELGMWQSAADSVRASDREHEATELVLGRAPCSAAALPSPLALSPERTFACNALVHAAEQPLLLELIIHDLLTLGLWALELSEQRADYRRILSQYAMAGRVSPDVGGKLARQVAAAPEVALRGAQVGQELAALPATARPAWIRDYLQHGAFLDVELRP